MSHVSHTQSLPDELLQQCLFLAGPTASGKTDVSLLWAQQAGDIEIVSLDSMTLYRGMDIGTAKVTATERERVPHHLIDILDVHEEFSVADYLAAARQVCEGIVGRGRRPLFVGGTGLYLRSILRGVFEGPPADWSIRQRLEEQAQQASLKGDGFWLMRQLEKVDAEAALRLHPNDQRRLIRALEVYELTGKPLSAQQQQPARQPEQRPRHVYWLDVPRDWLHQRIDSRVDRMFVTGLLDEVRALLRLPQTISHTARQGLGYKELMDALHNDPSAELSDTDLDAAKDLIKVRTRQFAKRQGTWFRNLEECVAITVEGDEPASSLAEKLLQRSGPLSSRSH